MDYTDFLTNHPHMNFIKALSVQHSFFYYHTNLFVPMIALHPQKMLGVVREIIRF